MDADVQNRVLDTCVQLHGGYGYMNEYRVARAWVDARVTKIWAGSNEIMKEVVGRSLTALLHPGPRPAVLLIDEVDRADDEFEAFLFELLAEAAVTIPELGTQQAVLPPVTVLTSNRTRSNTYASVRAGTRPLLLRASHDGTPLPRVFVSVASKGLISNEFGRVKQFWLGFWLGRA